jgi:hypothetical protein
VTDLPAGIVRKGHRAAAQGLERVLDLAPVKVARQVV